MISAAGAGVPPVDHEFFGAQTALPRQFVKLRCVLHKFVPTSGGLDVHFKNTRVGGDFEHRNTRIIRRRVALDHHLHLKVRGSVFNGRDQIQVVGKKFHRRHKDEQLSVARLNAYRGPGDPWRRLAFFEIFGVFARRFRLIRERRRGKEVGPPARPAWQFVALLKRVRIVTPRDVFGLGPGERVEGQPISHG